MSLINCPECSNEISNQSVTCPKCGYPIKNQNTYVYQQPVSSSVDTHSSFGYAVLGFFIPVVGLILFLVWNSSQPGKAKSAGKGALFSVIIGTAIYMLAACAAAISY